MRKNDALKVIGLITMLVDHVSLFLYGGNPLIYVIARFIGFPFFAYGVAVGAVHTSNPRRYITRLLFFGIISQPLFYYATDQARLNVVFTLALGVIAVRLFHSGILFQQISAFLVCLLGGTWSAPFVDYGAYGVAMILFFSVSGWHAILYMIWTSVYFHFNSDVQFFAVFSLLFIYCWRVPEIRLPRWFFYVAYPGHLLIIALARVFV